MDGNFHERCHCNLPLQTCKAYCDQDSNCLGYVQHPNGPDWCNYATTSECQQSCKKHSQGVLGPLGGDCGGCYGGGCYGGCYIKN